MALFHHITTFQLLLSFGVAAAPPMDSGLLWQPSGTISLLTTNGALTSSPTAIAAITNSGSRAPPSNPPDLPLLSPLPYRIHLTNPPIWLYLYNVQAQTRIKLYDVNYALTYRLEQTVLDCIAARGDYPLPDTGLRVISNDVGIVIGNRPLSTPLMTHSSAASVFRGLWEIMNVVGPSTVIADIYVGGQLDQDYVGVLSVYQRVGKNASVVGVA